MTRNRGDLDVGLFDLQKFDVNSSRIGLAESAGAAM
jgi:hypothetical protein